MALFMAPGPNGQTLQIDAPDEAAAAQAVGEMMQGGGGQNTMQGGGGGNPFMGITERAKQAGVPVRPSSGGGGNPFMTGEVSQGEQFRQAFDPSQDSSATAAGLDKRLGGDEVTGIFNRLAAAAQGAPEGEPYTGQILPFSKDAQGNVSFDSNAGIVGMGKRLVGGIDDVMSGRVDPKSDQGIANITNAAMVGTPVSAGTRGGLGWSGRPLRTRAPVATPTGQELIGAGDRGFNAARQMGVRYDPRAVQTMALNVRTRLLEAGFRKKNAPGTFAELKGLLKPIEDGSFATIDDLHSVRQALSRAAQNFQKPADQDAAVQAIQAIDEFIRNPDAAGVMAGPAAAAGKTWGGAMGNYAAGKRSDRLVDKPTSLEERTERSQHPLSTGSIDKITRDRVATLLNNPKTAAGFNQEERFLLNQVVQGKVPRNVMSLIGKLMGASLGPATISAAATGAYFGGIPGALMAGAPGAIIGGARWAGGKLTKGALNKTAERVRQRSPLYEERAANAPPVQQANPSVRMIGPRGIGNMVTTPPQMTPGQYDEYLRQKWAVEQGA